MAIARGEIDRRLAERVLNSEHKVVGSTPPDVYRRIGGDHGIGVDREFGGLKGARLGQNARSVCPKPASVPGGGHKHYPCAAQCIDGDFKGVRAIVGAGARGGEGIHHDERLPALSGDRHKPTPRVDDVCG